MLRELINWLTLIWEWLSFYREYVLLFATVTLGALIIIFRSEFHPWIIQHMVEFIGIVVAILAPGIGGAVTLVRARRKEKKEIEEKVSLAFRDIASLRPHLQLSKADTLRFYSGEKLEHCFWEIIKDELDFRRPVLSQLYEEFASWNGKEFIECKTPVGEVQGKSLLMGRFAWDLSKSSGNKVLWWLGDKAHSANVELALWLIKYRKNLTRTKKLIVFMDDLLPEEGEEWRFDVLHRLSAYHFLQTINKEPIFIVYPSKQKGELKFQAEDRDLLLSKLVEKGLIDKSFAKRFGEDAALQKLYKDQLRLCLNLIAEKCQFMPRFQRDILREKLSPEEDEALRRVSVCSTVSLSYPELALRNKSAKFWRSVKLGVLKNSLEEVTFETGKEIYDLNVDNKDAVKGYALVAPLVGKQVLRERCRIIDSKTLVNEYAETLLEILSSAQNQSEAHFVLEYVRAALCRLAKNLQRPFYPEFIGSVLAFEVLAHIPLKEKIAQSVENLSNLDEILRWAFTLKRLQYQDVAIRLFEKADRIAHSRGIRELDLEQVIHIAIGLKDSDVGEQKKRATIYFESAVKRTFNEGTQKLSNQVIDAYVELVNSLSGSQQALDKLDEFVKLGGREFKADSVLVRRRAELLDEIPNRTREAQDEFKRAIKLAEEYFASGESLIINLQRYAHFLSQRREQLDPTFLEDPDIYFQKAADLAKEVGFGYEAVMNAWAAHKEKRRDLKGAKSLYEAVIEYCKEKSMVHSPSLLAFAAFLHKFGQLFKDRAYAEWWQMAEDCCREIIECEGSDRFSRLHAYHQLGLLMGSSLPKIPRLPNGSERPDFPNSILMLEKAFESPEPQRMDDSQKTFQDCITHRALAQTFVRWFVAIEHGKVVEIEPVAQLLKKAEFHSLKAFSGLHRKLNLTTKLKEHIINSQIEYAGFQWLRNKDVHTAHANYDEAIKYLEIWSINVRAPELACKSYWYSANFYFYLYKKSGFERTDHLDISEHMYKKALQKMSERTSRQERARLRYRAVVCLHQQMWRLRSTKHYDVEQQKMDEALLIVDEGLAEDTQNPYLWSAKILLHIWKNNFGLAVQQLSRRELATINQSLKTLMRSSRQAARKVAENLEAFQTELKNKLNAASLQNQCAFFALMSILDPNLGSLMLDDKRIREDLSERLNSSTATGIAQIVGLLSKASRIRAFFDLCLSLNYLRIISSSTVTSNYRLLERFLEKDAEDFAKCFVKALPDASWADLTAKEDASLYRLNGILNDASKVDPKEAERLAESLSKINLNPLFLRTDPVAQIRGFTQANVVNLFLSKRISISPLSATQIAGSIHDQEWLYLINSATGDQSFWLLWNIYRYAPNRVMSLAKQDVAQQLQIRIKDQTLLIRLALAGLLHLCNVETGDVNLSDNDTIALKQAIKEHVTEKKLTLPLLSLISLKAKLEPSKYKEFAEIVDEKFVAKTIRDIKDQNLKELLAKMADDCFQQRPEADQN